MSIPRMKRFLVFWFLLAFSAGWCLPGRCASPRELYEIADRKAVAGQPDFAFMYFRTLLRDFPDSELAQPALFAQGEYYFSFPDYDRCVASFETYTEKYPDAQDKLFALAYLLKIARIRSQAGRVQRFEKEIISLKQLGLVFSEFKEYATRTPLHKDFKAVFHIDQITFFLQGDIFEEIRY